MTRTTRTTMKGIVAGSLVTGLAASVLAVSLTLPTDAAYRFEPVSASQETGATVSTSLLESKSGSGNTVIDTAVHPSGRIFTVQKDGSAAAGGDVLHTAETIEGDATAWPVDIPGESRSIDVQRIAIDPSTGLLWVAFVLDLSPTPKLQLATFRVYPTDDGLALEEWTQRGTLGWGSAPAVSVVDIDARDGRAVLVYGDPSAAIDRSALAAIHASPLTVLDWWAVAYSAITSVSLGSDGNRSIAFLASDRQVTSPVGSSYRFVEVVADVVTSAGPDTFYSATLDGSLSGTSYSIVSRHAADGTLVFTTTIASGAEVKSSDRSGSLLLVDPASGVLLHWQRGGSAVAIHTVDGDTVTDTGSRISTTGTLVRGLFHREHSTATIMTTRGVAEWFFTA